MMSAARNHNSLVKLNENSDGPQIVFMPMRDGDIFYARPIVKALGTEFGCYGLRLPPDVLTETSTHSIASIAKFFAIDILNQASSKRIHLFGYSFGGLIAFETGRALEGLGKKVERIWIGDTDVKRFAPVPMLFLRSPLSEFLQLLRFLKYNWRSCIWPETNTNIVRSYRFRYPFDAGAEPVQYRTIARLLVLAAAKYAPAPWRGAPLVLLRATDGDQGVRDLGWCRLVGEEIRIVNIEAGHGNMTKLPRPVMQIATAIKVGILETS